MGISGTTYHPLDIPQVLNETFEYLLSVADSICDPFEQSFFVMIHLPYLQAFEDINKRVSRLVANIPFIKNNLAPLSFVDVPVYDYASGILAVYELNNVELLKEVFVWAYERSAKHYQVVLDMIGQPNIIQLKFRKELKSLIHYIIVENISGKHIIQTITLWTKKHIEKESQFKFIRCAGKEIASLHIGNIAVYNIDLAVFIQWQKVQDDFYQK